MDQLECGMLIEQPNRKTIVSGKIPFFKNIKRKQWGAKPISCLFDLLEKKVKQPVPSSVYLYEIRTNFLQVVELTSHLHVLCTYESYFLIRSKVIQKRLLYTKLY